MADPTRDELIATAQAAADKALAEAHREVIETHQLMWAARREAEEAEYKMHRIVRETRAFYASKLDTSKALLERLSIVMRANAKRCETLGHLNRIDGHKDLLTEAEAFCRGLELTRFIKGDPADGAS